MIAQKMMIAVALGQSHREGSNRVREQTQREGGLRPIRSPTLLPIRMNSADTRASNAIAA